MTRIASWNSARDVWETEAVSLLSGRSDVFSETFPISGSMRNGVAYQLPMSAPRMDASGSLFSQLGGKLIPTPRASDGAHGGPNQRGSKGDLTVSSAVALLPTPAAGNPNDGENTDDWLARRERVKATGVNGNGMGMPLGIAVQLLPTPRSNEANGVGVHGDGGNDLRTTISLLPTPAASDSTGGRVSSEMGGVRESGSKRSVTLSTAVHHELLPTPRATRGGSATEIAYGFGGERTDEHRQQGTVELPGESNWGPYAAAIERWAAVLGREAPDPTELGPKGGRRLSSSFVEWMMGLPTGWVTGLGLPRTAELRMLGNGVVTQQAVAALASMRAARSINEGETK